MEVIRTGPDAADAAYSLWLGVARRNAHEVARRLGIPRDTVQSWHDRYRWRDRAATDDRVRAERSTAVAWSIIADTVIDAALVTRAATLGTGYTATDGSVHSRPDQEQRRSAQGTLAYAGIVATRRLAVAMDRPLSPRIDDATLDALVASGDRAALRALSRGAPLPAAPPPDFASDQPGGRGVPGSPFAVSAETESPQPKPQQPESDPDWGAAVDAVYRDLDGKEGTSGYPPKPRHTRGG